MKIVGFLILVFLWMGAGKAGAQGRIALPSARIQLPSAKPEAVAESEADQKPIESEALQREAAELPEELPVESPIPEEAAVPSEMADVSQGAAGAVESTQTADDSELPSAEGEGVAEIEKANATAAEPVQSAEEEEVIDPVNQLVTNLVPTNQVESISEDIPFDPNLWLAPWREKEEKHNTQLRAEVAEVTAALEENEQADLYLRRADLFIELGEYLAAEKDLHAAEDLDEEVLASVHIGMGRLAAVQGNTRGAAAEYGKSIRIEQDNPDAFYYRGKLYEFQDMSQRAIRDYERVLSLDPGHVPALVGIGVLQLERENFSVALSSLNRALELHPEHADALLNRGKLYLITGQHEAAFNDLTMALEVMQPSADLMFMRGKAAHALSNDELAVQDFTVANTLDPTRADILISRSQSWQALGESAKARADRVRAYDAIYP